MDPILTTAHGHQVQPLPDGGGVQITQAGREVAQLTWQEVAVIAKADPKALPVDGSAGKET